MLIARLGPSFHQRAETSKWGAGPCATVALVASNAPRATLDVWLGSFVVYHPKSKVSLNAIRRRPLAAYALIELEITNMDGMAPYVAAVSDTVTSHGGRYLVRPGPMNVVEGGVGEFPMKVVLEFPSMATAEAWYNSPEYQAILPHRLANSNGNFIWIEGV